MATWNQNMNSGGLLAGLGGNNENAPQAGNVNATLGLIQGNNEFARAGGNNVALQGLQGLSDVAGVYQQQKQQEALGAFNKVHADAWNSGDTSGLRKFAAANPAFVAQAQQAVAGLNTQQRADMTDQAAKLRLALAQGPEAYTQYISKNVADLSRVGADPNVLAQIGAQNPQGAAQMFDTLGMAGSGAKYWDIVDKQQGHQVAMRGQDITARGQDLTAETARRGQNLSYQSSMTGHSLTSQRLSLDKQKFDFEMQQAMQKAEELKSGAPKLTDATSKMIDTSVTSANSSRTSASSMNTLAEQLEKEKPTAGIFGSMQNNIAKMSGSDTYIRDLKVRRSQLASSQAVKNLPPGPASDKDIQFAREGIPSDTDSPEVWARWLRGNAKMEQINADYNDFKAEWISANGNPGQSKKDSNILGVDVKKGESINSAMRRFISTQSSAPGNTESPITEKVSSGSLPAYQPRQQYGQTKAQAQQTQQTSPAPATALQALQANPGLAQQFQAKYGYLPQGFQ